MDIELPRDSDGDMDWNTLGNLLTAHILGEVLHAKYKDFKYGRVTREMSSVDTDWQFCYEEGDVVVLKKIYPGNPLHAFMGRGLIDLPMEDVVLYMKDVSHREQWDKYLVDIQVVRELSSTDFVVHMHHKARKCLIRAERDWLYYERACHVDDKFVMTVRSVELPDYPPKPGLTRAELLPGSGWVLEPYDGSSSTTLISYVAHLDLKALPPIIMNRTLQKQVMAIRYIRDILLPPSPSPSPSPSPIRRKRQPKARRAGGNKKRSNGGGREGAVKDSSPRDRQQSRQHEDEEEEEGERVGEQFGSGTHRSGAPFEDPVSVYEFTQGVLQRERAFKRMESVPWDMHHRWNGDGHSHTHMEAIEASTMRERLRSYSEGEHASIHSIPILKPTQHTSEDKGQTTS